MMNPQYKSNNMINIILSNRKKRSIRRKRLTSSNHKAVSKVVNTRKARPILHRNMNGIITALHPEQTYWYRSYILSPQLSNRKFNNKFRRRFRMPHSSFIWLLGEVTNHHLFKRWNHLIQSYKKEPY